MSVCMCEGVIVFLCGVLAFCGAVRYTFAVGGVVNYFLGKEPTVWERDPLSGGRDPLSGERDPLSGGGRRGYVCFAVLTETQICQMASELDDT